MGAVSRMATKCRKCPDRDKCNHKRIEACAYYDEMSLATTRNDLTQMAAAPILRETMQIDPVAKWTKASGMFIPVLPDPYGMVIATVNTDVGNLTVTSAAGTTSGTTKVTVSPAKESGNLYKYKVGDAAESVTSGQNVKTWTAWDGTADITAATGKTITIVECGSDYKALKAGSATVTAKA